jgi:hypothetical protein
MSTSTTTIIQQELATPSKINFGRILEAVARDKGIETVSTPSSGSFRADRMLVTENNRVRRTASLTDYNGFLRIEYSSTKIRGVATGKKKATFVVDADWLEDHATKIIDRYIQFVS